MSGETMRHLWDEAERDPRFQKELAILEFTEELSRVMRAAGVTRTELAHRIGSSQAYVSRVLNGGANFTLGSMTKLASGLGLELKTAPRAGKRSDDLARPSPRASRNGRGRPADRGRSRARVRSRGPLCGAAATERATAALADAEVDRGAATTAA